MITEPWVFVDDPNAKPGVAKDSDSRWLEHLDLPAEKSGHRWERRIPDVDKWEKAGCDSDCWETT